MRIISLKKLSSTYSWHSLWSCLSFKTDCLLFITWDRRLRPLDSVLRIGRAGVLHFKYWWRLSSYVNEKGEFSGTLMVMGFFSKYLKYVSNTYPITLGVLTVISVLRLTSSFYFLINAFLASCNSCLYCSTTLRASLSLAWAWLF